MVQEQGILCRSEPSDELRNVIEGSFEDEQFHAVVITDVAVQVGRDEAVVFVAEIDQGSLDFGRFIIEEDCDDTHEVPVFEPTVVEFLHERATRLAEHLAATGESMLVRETIEALEQGIRHRNTDDGHVLTQGPDLNNVADPAMNFAGCT